MKSDSLLTIPAFCERFSISRSTYYNLRRAGEGPQIHEIGGRRVITESDAESWFRSKAA